MKRLILLFSVCIICLSCVENKSVISVLNLEDVNKMINKDSLYELIILDIDTNRLKFDENIILKSKFKDLTYSEYLDYKKKTDKSKIFYECYLKADSIHSKEMDAIIKKYKPVIDSTIASYKSLHKKNTPENYFDVEFNSIKKEYYSYDNSVKDLYVKFKITPLLGDIQGGAFRYRIYPKVTNVEVANGGCRFSQFTFTDEIYSWEAPYDVKKEFSNATTEYIKDNYYFEYTYLTVRVNDTTYSSDNIKVPYFYELYMEDDSISTWEYESLIRYELDIPIEYQIDLADKLYQQKKKLVNPLAFEFESILNDY